MYSLWFALFIFGVIWTLAFPPEKAIVFFNTFYSDPILFVLTWSTRMGELLGFVLVLMVLVIRGNYRHLLAYIVAVVAVLLLMWFLKHVVYFDAIRPSVYFERMGIELPNRSSYTLNRKFSFPSGHTAAGFTYFFFLGLCATSNWQRVICLLFAVMVGLSRVYLAQHFVSDVTAGSLVGVLVASLSYYFLVHRSPWKDSKLDKCIIPSAHNE